MRVSGFNEEDVSSVCGVLAAILNLGELKFSPHSDDEKVGYVKIKRDVRIKQIKNQKSSIRNIQMKNSSPRRKVRIDTLTVTWYQKPNTQ